MKNLIASLFALLFTFSFCYSQETDTVWTRWMFNPTDVNFLPDGNSMLCATADGIIHIGIDGNPIDTFKYQTILFDIYPDGNKFIFWSYSSIFVFDLLIKDTIKSFSFDNKIQAVSRVAPTKDGKYIITTILDKKEFAASNSFKVYIWDAITFQLIKIVPVIDWTVGNGGMVLDEKNEYFLICENQYNGGDYFKISKWKIGTWEKEKDLYTFPKNTNISEIRISPDSKYFAVALFSEAKVKLFDYHTGNFIKDFTLSANPVYSICFSNNSKFLIASANEVKTSIWNIENGDLFLQYNFHLRYIDISKDSKFIAGYGRIGNSNKVILLVTPSELTHINQKDQEIEGIVFPNPTTGEAEISFELEKATITTIELYDENGQKLNEIFSGSLAEGVNQIKIQLNQYPQGIYYCRVKTNDSNNTIKIIKIN